MSSETPRAASTEWKWRRREAIIRDDYTCQECGAEGGPKGDTRLEVHHITPVSEGGSNGKENLVTLCDSCHTGRHGRIPLNGVLGVCDKVEGPSVITSSDVSEELDCTTEAARQKLQQLVENGALVRRRSGRTVLYWRAGDE